MILLFDVDGTLAPSTEKIESVTIETLKVISSKPNVKLGIVGGGTFKKVSEQLGDSINMFDYIFCESGAIVYIDGKLSQSVSKNIIENCDRELLNSLIRESLKAISEMPIIYNGNQIDFRQGLVYVSPPGMQAGKFEREYFLKIDSEQNLRKNLILRLRKIDSDNQFDIVLGGSVGVSIYPKGWDKSQVLEHFKNTSEEIYFFGDRTDPDGNDYPLYSHPRVKGVSVKNPTDTLQKLKSLFL